MTRRTGGRAAQQLGAAWEAEIRRDLASWTSEQILHDWQQQGPLYLRVGARGGRVVPVDAFGPVDFCAWDGRGAWMFEAKISSSTRWPYARLEPHQSARLTSWHSPASGRHAGVALRFGALATGTGRPLDLWLPWDALAPLWGRWAVGRAPRGGASLTIDDATCLGMLWGGQWGVTR